MQQRARLARRSSGALKRRSSTETRPPAPAARSPAEPAAQPPEASGNTVATAAAHVPESAYQHCNGFFASDSAWASQVGLSFAAPNAVHSSSGTLVGSHSTGLPASGSSSGSGNLRASHSAGDAALAAPPQLLDVRHNLAPAGSCLPYNDAGMAALQQFGGVMQHSAPGGSAHRDGRQPCSDAGWAAFPLANSSGCHGSATGTEYTDGGQGRSVQTRSNPECSASAGKFSDAPAGLPPRSFSLSEPPFQRGAIHQAHPGAMQQSPHPGALQQQQSAQQHGAPSQFAADAAYGTAYTGGVGWGNGSGSGGCCSSSNGVGVKPGPFPWAERSHLAIVMDLPLYSPGMAAQVLRNNL